MKGLVIAALVCTVTIIIAIWPLFELLWNIINKKSTKRKKK